MKSVWDNIFESELWCTDLEPREFVKENVKDIARPGPVLDVGCGCGRHTVFLAANGYNVYGIDNSSVALNRTIKHLNSFGLSATLEQCDMWNIPFEDIKFSAALCINVLNHAMPSKINLTISVIANRLADNGMFLVTLLTDNDYRKCGEQVDINTFICNSGPENGVLYTFFNENSVNELLRSSFRIESIEIAKGTNKIENNKEVMMEFFKIKAKKIGN